MPAALLVGLLQFSGELAAAIDVRGSNALLEEQVAFRNTSIEPSADPQENLRRSVGCFRPSHANRRTAKLVRYGRWATSRIALWRTVRTSALPGQNPVGSPAESFR
jgi:hypothetical protein